MDAIEVKCSVCQVPPGAPCTAPTSTGRRPVTWFHAERTRDALQKVRLSPSPRYLAKQRLMRLGWLRDTIAHETVKHLDSGNIPRVEILDARFNAVEDEMMRVWEESHG
jgi:hypothetical protein